jgi:hypothetical protein
MMAREEDAGCRPRGHDEASRADERAPPQCMASTLSRSKGLHHSGVEAERDNCELRLE